jgi:cytochrome c biogenesis protein ResB
MKKIVLFILLLLIINMMACSFKEPPPKTKSNKEKTVSEQQDTEIEDPNDFQAGIPEEYRLKVNITDDYYEPLPESDVTLDSPLFKIGERINE